MILTAGCHRVHLTFCGRSWGQTRDRLIPDRLILGRDAPSQQRHEADTGPFGDILMHMHRDHACTLPARMALMPSSMKSRRGCTHSA